MPLCAHHQALTRAVRGDSKALGQMRPLDWRWHLSAETMLAHVGKGLEIPKRWTAAEFARQGRALIVTMARLAKLTQRRAAPIVAMKANAIFVRQIERVVDRVLRWSGHKEPVELTLPQHEAMWLRAIEEVFAEAGLEVVTELVPPVQSVMAQGYSRTAILLGQEADPDRSPQIARESREIAEKITRINDTTRRDIRRVVEDGMRQGQTVPEVAAEVRRRVPAIAGSRSLTIARTELNQAWTRGAAQSFRESQTLTHLSVIGCEAREENSPQFRGESTCNIEDVPIQDLDELMAVGWHINHIGTLIPSGFRDE